MPALNESALAGLTPERAAEIRAKAAADAAAKKAANGEKYGAFPDPKTDPDGWKFAQFRYMYQALRRLMAARTKSEPDNAAVKRVWNALMDARPDLIGADTETIRQAFDAEHAAERAERADEAADLQRATAEYFAAQSKPNPLNAPRQKRIGGQPTSRKLSEIMQEFPMPTKSVFPPLPAEKPTTPKPPVDPELAAAFPRDAAGNPIPDVSAGEAESAMIDVDPTIPPSPRVVTPAPRWQDDPSKLDGFRKAVFAEINRTYGEGAITAQGVNEIVRAALGCAVDEWQGTGSEALTKIKGYLKAQQPPDDYPAEPPAETPSETAQNGAVNTPPATVTPKPAETPRHAPSMNGSNDAKLPPKPAAQTAPKGNPFKPAKKEGSFLRLAVAGTAGSGKTFTALSIASQMIADGKIALLDTERGSARKYADLFSFDVLELGNFAPQRLIDAVKAAEGYGYDVLIVDSFSHFWNGTGGILEMVEKQKGQSRGGNDFAAWKDATPLQNAMIDAILTANLHIVCTMRAKTEYVIEQVERGGRFVNVPKKVGLAPVQRQDVEYEFDVYATITGEHEMRIEKTRCSALDGQTFDRAGGDVAAILAKWLQ